MIIIFVLGLFIAKDFGISWDESHHRDSGQRIAAYLIKFFGLENIRPIPPELKDFDYMQKRYGPIFDTVSAVIEEVFQIERHERHFYYAPLFKFYFLFSGYL